VRICADTVVAGVRVCTLLPNIGPVDSGKMAPAQPFTQLEGLAFRTNSQFARTLNYWDGTWTLILDCCGFPRAFCSFFWRSCRSSWPS